VNEVLSTAEAARILGLREGRVRELVRAGLARPVRHGRRYAFSFQDLVALRTGQALLLSGVSIARVRRALTKLQSDLGDERPLSGLRIYADGREVAVRQGTTAWHPETGQTLLNFEVDELAQRVAEVREAEHEKPTSGDPLRQAGLEFESALALEDGDPAAAADAYARALELDPALVDAYVNLGRIAHETGNARAAVRFYEQALALSEDDPIIHFNLALALEDTKGLAPAVAHYERALELDVDFADAHYNLAGLCEKLGHAADALRHYHAYKKLTSP